MTIRTIDKEELRRMQDKEGLILQVGGGSAESWLNWLNQTLTENGTLQDGTVFQECLSFSCDDATCFLFPFDDSVKLDIGKLSMWRLNYHSALGGTWLSDFVENRLGGFLTQEEKPQREKPPCPLIGADGNIFNLMGLASRTLKKHGMADEAKEMFARCTASGSYDEALAIITDYVEPVAVGEEDENESPGMTFH